MKLKAIPSPLLVLIFAMLSLGMRANAQELTVCSFNIRLNVASDSPNHWKARRHLVSSQVLFHQVDLLGVQEALPNQVADMKRDLPGFGFTGVGRDDGKAKGEFSGIFYREQMLALQDSGTFWLSLTPKVPGSKSWDAAITRIVTWARFKHKRTGRIFYHFNTHFDHIGQEARRNSALLLLQKVHEMAGKLPVVVTGDFNAKPEDEPIRVLVGAHDPLRLYDTKALSLQPHYGPEATFNGFKEKEQPGGPIDHIFIKPKQSWIVRQHASISQTWMGRFASDHFAVISTLKLK